MEFEDNKNFKGLEGSLEEKENDELIMKQIVISISFILFGIYKIYKIFK